MKIAPSLNSNANPKPNPNPDQGTIFLGVNCPDTLQGSKWAITMNPISIESTLLLFFLIQNFLVKTHPCHFSFLQSFQLDLSIGIFGVSVAIAEISVCKC